MLGRVYSWPSHAAPRAFHISQLQGPADLKGDDIIMCFICKLFWQFNNISNILVINELCGEVVGAPNSNILAHS